MRHGRTDLKETTQMGPMGQMQQIVRRAVGKGDAASTRVLFEKNLIDSTAAPESPGITS
jgi:hypothetical protein